jgi:hypothetical protein
MPILDDLKQPLRKIILENPLFGFFNETLALVSFIDSKNGRRLSISVPYVKEHRIIRIICPKSEKCWKKFSDGSPVSISIKGEGYQGWGEIIDDPVEIQKEWFSMIRKKPEIISQLGISNNSDEELDTEEIYSRVKEWDILRIEVSERS